jgi:hypothetical protein
MSATPQTRFTASLEFLGSFFERTTHDIELRAFTAQRTGQPKQLFSRDLDALDNFLRENKHLEVYFGCATREGGRGKKENCREAVALYADMDFKNYAVPEDMKEAHARTLLLKFPLQPSIVIHSGGGFHVYWLFDKSANLQVTDVEPILRDIARALDADPACAEKARVLRLPGTLNHKPDYPSPREVHIVEADWNLRYALADFSAIAFPEKPRGFENMGPSDIAQYGILLPAHVKDFGVLLASRRLKFQKRVENGQISYDYHGLKEHSAAPEQPCLIQGTVHEGQIGNPRQCRFLVKDGYVAHQCFDSDCQAFTGHKTRHALAALGFDANLNNIPAMRGGVTGFILTPLGDLLARPDIPVEYVVENLLVSGTVACIVAKPKVGKSTFARNLCLSVSRGVDFLGLKTKQGQCIYLALEEREEDLKNDFRAMGADGSEPIYTHAAAAPAQGIEAACDLVRQRRPVLVVVDPLFRLARIKDEKAYAETYAALGPLIDVAREVGTLVVLVHHAGKSAKADAIDSPLGSTAIGGAVCTVVLLKKQTDSGTRTLQTVTRIGQEMPETVLRFDAASRSLSLGPRKDDADVQAAEEASLEYLKGVSEPKTEPEIDEAVEGKTGLKRKALRSLATRGKVTREGGGKKGDPYKYAFSFSCSQDIAGTREQETEKANEPRINTGDNLVPSSSPTSFLVPGQDGQAGADVLEV